MINLKRNERGITLIALIITIVVLLILAIVAIGQAKENNIVGYAQNATDRYAEEQAKEGNMLGSYENIIQSIMGPWSPLTVPVQFDKKYSNYITVDGETEFVEIILYSDGRMHLWGDELDKEEVEEIIKDGQIKVTNKAILIDDLKFEFSDDGKEITLYYEGVSIGVLTTDEKEPQNSEWTAYGEESEYFLVGANKSYFIQNGNITNEFIIKTDKTLVQYFNGYNIDSKISSISTVLVYTFNNTEYAGAVIASEAVNTFLLDNNTNYLSINKTYNKNNTIDYSSILEQIENN